MRLVPSQKGYKNLHQVGLVLLVAGGCVPGYQDTPYPPCFLPDDPDPACHAEQAEEGATAETATPTTGTLFPGEGSDSGGAETGADEVGASSGASTGTTGPEVQAEPVIVGMSLTPGPGTPGSCVLDLAGPVAVTVQTEAAGEVWITVDDGEAVALEPVGDDGTEFVGEIAVLGESWNGSHTVSAVAQSGELVSAPWVDMFSVTAPAAGSELWKKKSTITPSKGNAVAVDAQGEVYELFTQWSPQGARCHVRRRDTEGEPVWPQDAVALAAGVSCGGEDIEVAPDGTIWALANTVVDEVNRWQLFHLDSDGMLLDAPQVGDFQEFGRGLDVNAAGDLLLCGVRPGTLDPDAWVRLSLSAGKGWTVPWVYKFEGLEFDERTRDCAFVEDRIVVVGEVFGQHDEFDPWKLSRGSVVEFGTNGAKLSEAVATDEPTLQSGYEAVAPDGDGGYVAVGYTCDANVTPCSPTQGIETWFSPGASLTWAQPVTAAATVWGVAASPSGGVVVAAEALIKGKGFLAQAWAPGKGEPSWEYQGTLSTLQVATGIAVGPFGYISVGGGIL